MTSTTLTVTHIESIGRADRTLSKRAAAVVAHPANVDRDWTKRGAIAAGILATLGVESHPKPLTTGPKTARVDTLYGQGFRVLSDAVRRATKADTVPAVALRVTLSGPDQSGSVTVPTDHSMYAALVKMVMADNGK